MSKWTYDDVDTPNGIVMYWSMNTDDNNHYYIYPYMLEGFKVVHENWTLPLDEDTEELGTFTSRKKAKRFVKKYIKKNDE
jgi:hypothetical protein